MPFPNKDSALNALEIARAQYLADARHHAAMLAKDGRAISVDDVRRVCPPPKNIDGRIMGAIFRGQEWEPVAFFNSGRRTCHNRPIRLFRLKHAGE